MSDNKEETKEPAAEEKKAPEIGQMKRGDYMIHVFIEKARQIKTPDNGTVDPIVEVKVLEDKKFTTAKDDISGTGVVDWNEHLFFEPKNMTVEQIEGAKIQIKLMDKGYFKDAIIGVYTFDVAYIYFMDKHSLLHRWVALSNPASENFNEVAGYLKLSISVSTTGDEQIQITEDNSPESADEKVLMPPSIRPEYYQIRFKFFRAEHLPAMDTALVGKGSIDAYVLCNYQTTKLKTKVITAKEGTPVPLQLPIMSSRIVMKLYDEDKIADEVVASMNFNLKDCIGSLNGKFFWKNLYGSPLGKSGENTKHMNENPEVASTWKGRILMQVTAEKTEKPTCLVRSLTPEEIEAARKFAIPHEYEIMAEIGQGLSMPTVDKYSVKIKIADLEIKTDKASNVENTYNRWGFRKQVTWNTVYQDIYDVGRVYFYLCSGNDNICFYSADIELFNKPNPTWQWIELYPDLSMGKVTDPAKAGIISIKLSIHDKTIGGPIKFEDFTAWRKPPPKRLDLRKVRVYMFQCRDLPAADSDGASDPFIKVWDTTKDIKQTKVIYDNCNPLFYEVLEVLIETGPNIEQDFPPFIFDVYDKDTLSNDFICRAVVNLADAAYSIDDDCEKVMEPKWHGCKLKPKAPKSGEILVSFSISESDYNFKTPLQYMNLRNEVDFRETEVEINILGLRDLQSVGILPIKKAFLVFNLKSLVPPDDGRALENIRTQPNAAGPNPTINTTIKFKVPLPKKELFCPRLACQVFDYIFKGLGQPLVGTFTIPVGDLRDALREERSTETEAIQQAIDELDKIMRGEGIPTYGAINASINEDNFDDVSSRASMQIEKVKSSVKVDDEMRKPLLLNIQEEMDEEEKQAGRYKTPEMSPRHTPKSLMNQDRKKTVNVMKQQQNTVDKMANKAELLKETKEHEEKVQREIEATRQKEMQQFKSHGGASTKNIIMPTYEMDKRLNVMRENNPPPESLYIGCGFDPEPGVPQNPQEMKKTKHYRRYYPKELELVTEVMPIPTPFTQFKIMRGQSRGASKSWFSFGSKKEDDSGAVSTEQCVGTFKGVVAVQTPEEKQEYGEKKSELIHQLKTKLNNISLKKTGKPIDLRMEKMDTMEGRLKFDLELEKLGVAHLGITKKLADLESDETLRRLLMAQTKCIVRVYCLSAFNLSSRDNGSESDPYLILNVGGKTYNERDIYQLDNPNPEFHKYYDFEAVFPGTAPLVISVMDFDDIFGDDLIGKTNIDLEDRFFSPEWQSIKHKPIEYRSLYHPSTSISQGTIKLWVEINPTAIPQNEIPIYDTAPKPDEEFEVRVVIFDTVDVKMMDAEGTSDVYCRSFFDSRNDAKETDTHFRCQDGKASFNYRLLFNVKHSVVQGAKKNSTLSVQLYDRDFFKSNDIIGETTLNLEDAINDSSLTKRPLSINKKYYEDFMKAKGVKLEFKDDNTFFVVVKGKDEKTGQLVDNGKVRIQVDIYPKEHAEKNKVGEARQEPNHSPFLPPPVGRISLSLNPLKMFNQLVGPALRRKIYCYCCLALCIGLVILLFPLIAGNLISSLITNILF